MTTADAKKILALYRPGIDDNDPDIREALRVAETDSELKHWLEEHQRTQNNIRAKFRNIEVPRDLRDKIIAQHKIVRPSFTGQRTLLLAIAAVVLLFIGLAVFFRPGVSNRFADYESRIVRGALREYRMDLVTNDLAQIRLSMASRGAPSEFPLPKGLSKLPIIGGGALKWRNNAVTMVCFDRGDKQMLFFFVLNRAAVKDPPGQHPELQHINRLQAASWTHGDKVYVLAGPEDKEFVNKYL